MNIILLIQLIFAQCNFTQLCAENGCIYDGIPFGSSPELVKQQIRHINFNIKPVYDVNSKSLLYQGLSFWKYTEVNEVTFRFNDNDELSGVYVYFEPEDRTKYPELFDLYLDVRQGIEQSGKYDSVEYRYKFKNPYPEATEKEAIDGNFSYQEMDALKQDGSPRISNGRFGQVWSKFKSKNLPIKVTLMITYVQYLEQSGGHFVDYLAFEDTSRYHIKKSGF